MIDFAIEIKPNSGDVIHNLIYLKYEASIFYYAIKKRNLYSFLSGLQRQNCLERVIPYRKQKIFLQNSFL